MSRTERPGVDKTHVVPDPSDPRLFGFIEELFKQDQIPEQIELRQASGRGGRNYSENICPAETFKPNAPKPGREKLVAISNKFLDLAQHDCDELAAQQGYAVLAKHHARGADYYARYYFKLRPKRAAEGDVIDEEEENPEQRHRNAMLQFMLDHARQNDENDRLRQDQHSSATGDILAQQRQIIEMLMEDRRQDRQQYVDLQKEHRETIKLLDEALSRRQERELQAQMQQVKIAAITDGLNFVKSLLPVAVAKMGKSLPQNGSEIGDSPESIAIQQFILGLTDAQSETLFGKIVDGENKGGGIFTPTQTAIFVGVARREHPTSVLDSLFTGEHMLNAEQIDKAQKILRPEQFMPLIALMMERKK